MKLRAAAVSPVPVWLTVIDVVLKSEADSNLFHFLDLVIDGGQVP